MAFGSFFQRAVLKISNALSQLQERLGHRFERPELLIEATTHASFGGSNASDNQRFEFLGDRVLGLAISDIILNQFPDHDEGALAPIFNALVRKEACTEVAKDLEIGDALQMGRSEMLSGGRKKDAILGDAMEAVLAAVYIDAGFSKAKTLIEKHWARLLENVETHESRDAKTLLQEWAQARAMPPPKYTELERKGPDHALEFLIEALLENGEAAQAWASSKRAAQQEAAKILLKRLT